MSYAWFPPFRCRCTYLYVATVAVAGENGNAGKWKRLSVYIGMKRPERWLVVHQRQNGKK